MTDCPSDRMSHHVPGHEFLPLLAERVFGLVILTARCGASARLFSHKGPCGLKRTQSLKVEASAEHRGAGRVLMRPKKESAERHWQLIVIDVASVVLFIVLSVGVNTT